MAKLPSDIPEGTRVVAPHPEHYTQSGKKRLMPGTILDNLSVMYYILFDGDSTGQYVFKA